MREGNNFIKIQCTKIFKKRKYSVPTVKHAADIQSSAESTAGPQAPCYCVPSITLQTALGWILDDQLSLLNNMLEGFSESAHF